MKLRPLGLILVTVFLLTFSTSALASVKMEFCNENEFDIRWAFIAFYGGQIWGDGFYVSPAGQCKTSSFVIGADKIYFAFMTLDEKPRYYKLSLGGHKIVNDGNPVSEICIPIDGKHFYYQPDAAHYKADKVFKCPSRVSKSGGDYFQAATPRAMGIAQISSGIWVSGDNFLTVTIPKLNNPVTYELKDAEN